MQVVLRTIEKEGEKQELLINLVSLFDAVGIFPDLSVRALVATHYCSSREGVDLHCSTSGSSKK